MGQNGYGLFRFKLTGRVSFDLSYQSSCLVSIYLPRKVRLDIKVVMFDVLRFLEPITIRYSD